MAWVCTCGKTNEDDYTFCSCGTTQYKAADELDKSRQRVTSKTSAGKSAINKTVVGGLLLIIGVVGLVVAYSMRPPSGFGDVLGMLARGRDNFIKEPYYQILIAISGLITLFGTLLLFTGMKSKESKS